MRGQVGFSESDANLVLEKPISISNQDLTLCTVSEMK